jgi:hypothetical protein
MVQPANQRPRSAALAAVSAQKAPAAPTAPASKPPAEAPARSNVGRDTTSTRSSGKASSSVVIYDLDQHKRRAPNSDEMASIRQSAPNQRHFVKYTENGAPVMDIASEQDINQLEATDKANTPEAKAERRKERRINTAVSTGVGVAMDVGYGLKLAQASRVAATGAVVAKGAQGLGLIGGKILPAVGIVFGGIGIASDISRWNNPNNKKKADDVARIAGNTLSMVGSGLMIAGAGASATGVGAVAGVPLAAVGLIVSGVGLLVGGIGSWFDDDD